MNDKIAHMFAEAAMQKASYQIGDLMKEWPEDLWVYFLAAAQSLVTSLTPLLSKDDQELLAHIIAHTQATILPTALDPRKMGGKP